MTFLIYNKEKEYCELGLDWMSFTLKHPNEGGFKAKQKYQGSWDWSRDKLIKRVERLLNLKKGEVVQKNTTKGYNHIITYDNGLIIQFHDLYSYMGINIEINGETLRYMRLDGYSDLEIIQLLDFKIEERTANHIDEIVEWSCEPTRLDIAIDYFNTKMTVDTLANKVARKKSIDVWFDMYDKITGDYIERKSVAEPYVMMNDGVFNTLYIGRPGGAFQGRIYNKYEEQVNSKGNPVPEGVESWVRCELEMKQDMAISFVKSSQIVHSDEEFKSLILRFFIKKIKFKYSNGNYHELTKQMMKGAEDVEMVEYSKAKPDDILKAKYEHLINGSGLISFLQILSQLDPTGEKGLINSFLTLAQDEAKSRQISKDVKIHLNEIIRMVNTTDYTMPFELLSKND